MNYGLIYTVPFTTIDNKICVVEIEKDNYTGDVTELKAGSSPFAVDIDAEDFLYIPTRLSTAKLQVVGSDYLQSLFSTEYRQYRVTLKVNGSPAWCGFIKPELYTQDYTSELFILEIECISAMSVLEFIDYSTLSENKSFVSIWNILQRCIYTSCGKYNAVYIPYVYAKNKSDYDAETNVLADMKISEHNFFDEDGKPMKLNEVLQEVCKFLNWTCADWKGELYFIDIDHDGVYHKYDVGLTGKVNTYCNNLHVQNIGFAGSNHSLDILPGFNKVTVKCSNYTVGDMIQDEDYDKLRLLAQEEDKQVNIDGKDYVTRQMYYYSDKYKTTQLKRGTPTAVPIDNLSDYENKPTDVNELYGAVISKYCTYELDKGKPTIKDYKYTNTIRVRVSLNGKQAQITNGQVIVSAKGIASMYTDGAICIDGSLKLCKSDKGMNPAYKDLPKDIFGEAYKRIRFTDCRLRIGNKYWDGKENVWSDNPLSTFALYSEDINSDFMRLYDYKTLDMPYTGAVGYIIPINQVLYGDMEFSMLAPTSISLDIYGIYIKDFSIKFVKQEGANDPMNDTDRVYENALNESYINELDEIELKISSYNNDGACYSKVILGDNYLQDDLYNVILNQTKRPEELLITRIINHYGATNIKLTQVIKNNEDISPLTVLSDTFFPDKKFINAGGTIDYHDNSFECIMIEV